MCIETESRNPFLQASNEDLEWKVCKIGDKFFIFIWIVKASNNLVTVMKFIQAWNCVNKYLGSEKKAHFYRMQEVTMMHQKANTTKVPTQAFSCRFSDKGPLSNALSKLLASNVVGSFVYTCFLKNSWG